MTRLYRCARKSLYASVSSLYFLNLTFHFPLPLHLSRLSRRVPTAYPAPAPQWPSQRWQCASYVSSQCSLLFHVLCRCIDQGTCVLVGRRCVPANPLLALEIIVSLWDGYLHVLCRSCHDLFHVLAHVPPPIACIMSTCGGDWAGVTHCCVWPGTSFI